MSERRPLHARTGLRALALVALTLATFALFARARGHDFVSFDDPTYVSKNPHIARGLDAEGVRWAFSLNDYEANYHPLTWLSHMLDVELFGLEPGGPHLTNATLHALNTLLLVLALRVLTRRFWPSLLVGALFALHPLRAESVSWVSERKDVLAGTFWMLTLLAYGWWARRPHPAKYLLVVLALTFGLLSKAMGVTLPILLLGLDAWPLGRLRDRDELRKRILEKLPLFAPVVAIAALTVIAQARGGSLSTVELIPLWARTANAALSVFSYLGKFFWPTRLACFYPHPFRVDPDFALTSPTVLAALGGIVAVSVVAWSLRRRWPFLALGWFWYLVSLAPVIGLVQVGAQGLADRYTYLPLIGVGLALAFALAACSDRWPRTTPWLAASAVSALAACVPLTRAQIDTWQDSETLYAHALRVTEKNYKALNNYGLLQEARGDVEGAEASYEAALEARPDQPQALTNLGTLYHRRGDTERARELYERALDADPRLVAAHNNLGVLHMNAGRNEEAVRCFEAALETDPDHRDARTNAGRILQRRGMHEEALPHFERLAELQPQSAKAAYDLGSARLNAGRREEAIAAFERSVSLGDVNGSAAARLSRLRE